MRYKCAMCGECQWRGLFPEATFHIRYALFHGFAIGVCGVITRALFKRFGQTIEGWRNGLASLVVCALLVFVLYGVAVTVEALVVTRRPCRLCGERALHSN